MFKKHSVQMKLVKDPKNETSQTPKTNPVDYAKLVCESTKEVSKAAAIVIASYVVSDTFRRTVIHIVATKIH